MSKEQLLERIREREARIGVIGLGYVGLPLALEFAHLGYPTVGIDINAQRVAALQQGESYIGDIPSQRVAELINRGRFTATSDAQVIRDLDVVFICVPTPFDAMKAPDLSFIIAATRSIAPSLHAGQLVILQSTTYPGTTEEVCQPILEETGLKVGRDFYLAFSPERIDPGNQVYNVHNTPKVVGGVTGDCTQLAATLLEQMTPKVCIVSSPRAAEMTKLLENIFRSVNIALVNELALLSERMGIDLWEVIEAASTKPFGYLPFTPGPGVGGHCIPVDPYYLSWKAREFDFYTKFIELAAETNGDMPFHVVELVAAALNRVGKSVHGARLLILGVSFKRDIEDARNSPAERVIELLLTRGAQVHYHDPFVSVFHLGGDVFHRQPVQLQSVLLSEEEVRAADCVLIITGHRQLDYAWISERATLVVDTVNVTRNLANTRATIVRLGAPLDEDGG